MVRVDFKLTEAGIVELECDKPQDLDSILQQCAARAGIELGGYIAVRAGRVITASTLIDVDDSIEVFPAISGG